MKGDVARDGARQDRVRAVILVERLEHHDLVARIEDRQHRRDHALGGAADNRNLRVGIDRPAGIGSAGLGGDGVTKALGPPGDGVLVDIRVEGGLGCFLQLRRTWKVWEALCQVDGLMTKCQARHVPNHGLAEGLGPGRDARHPGSLSGRLASRLACRLRSRRSRPAAARTRLGDRRSPRRAQNLARSRGRRCRPRP